MMVASGRTLTEEHKARISASMTGENNPAKRPEVRAKISAALIGTKRSEESKAKQSATIMGRTLTETHKAKISAGLAGHILTEETKTKISIANKGKTPTEETRAKMSAALIERFRNPENNPMFGKTGKNNPNFGRICTQDTKAKISAALTAENNPRWQGGSSFEPYCPRFNYQLKEQIRNPDNRTCVLCQKGEIQNGHRLSVHHIDADKMQGCNGAKWYLCALCISCNSKPDTVEKEFLIVTNGGGSNR